MGGGHRSPCAAGALTLCPAAGGPCEPQVSAVRSRPAWRRCSRSAASGTRPRGRWPCRAWWRLPMTWSRPRQRIELAARSPHNVVHLILPEASSTDSSAENRYARAGRWFAEWLREGILQQDDRAAFYAIEQSFTGPDGRPRVRRSLVAACRVQDYADKAVLPHEKTLSAARADRSRDPDGTSEATSRRSSGSSRTSTGMESGRWRRRSPSRGTRSARPTPTTERTTGSGGSRTRSPRAGSRIC